MQFRYGDKIFGIFSVIELAVGRQLFKAKSAVTLHLKFNHCFSFCITTVCFETLKSKIIGTAPDKISEYFLNYYNKLVENFLSFEGRVDELPPCVS